MAIKKPLVVYSGSIEELHDADSIDVAVAGTLPTGGAAGQILAKIDATDYNAEWIDNYATELKLYVKNKTGSTINKGEVVYISGSDGNNALISKAQANSDVTSATTIGFLETTLATGDHGFVIIAGKLAGLNTNSATAGDPIWLSPTTAGAVLYGMANKPTAPDHLVYLGTVKRVQSVNGEIDIRVQNGYELDELHDVMAVGATSGQILIKDAVLSVWKAITINGTNGEVDVTSTKDGITISLPSTISANITGNAATVNNGLYTTDLGVSVQSYDADLAAIAALSGTSGLLKKTALNTWTLDTSTYLTAETDPIFGASPAAGITSTNISNWNTAYSWGNHASAGYLTSSVAASTYQPLDGDLSAIAALTGTSGTLKKTAENTWVLDTAAGGGGFSNIKFFTESGSFTVPSGISKIRVTVIGGGAGGSATYIGGSGATSSFGSLMTAVGGAGGRAQNAGTVSANSYVAGSFVANAQFGNAGKGGEGYGANAQYTIDSNGADGGAGTAIFEVVAGTVYGVTVGGGGGGGGGGGNAGSNGGNGGSSGNSGGSGGGSRYGGNGGNGFGGGGGGGGGWNGLGAASFAGGTGGNGGTATVNATAGANGYAAIDVAGGGKGYGGGGGGGGSGNGGFGAASGGNGGIVIVEW